MPTRTPEDELASACGSWFPACGSWAPACGSWFPACGSWFPARGSWADNHPSMPFGK